MSNQIKSTTPGEWIVTEEDDQIMVVANGLKDQPEMQASIRRVIAVFGDSDSQYAGERLANAALMSISKEMLDALIAIHESARMEISSGVKYMNANAIDEMISEVLSKLANEAGEEL